MSAITKLISIRYSKPIDALKEDGLIKLLFTILAYIITTATDLINVLGDIFRTPGELILLLMVAILIDWYTGIMKARKNGVYIRSLGLRQSLIKVLEYGGFLILLSGMANVFGATTINGWVGDSLRFLHNIHWLGYLYATFTELKSVAENLDGKEGRFGEIISKINEKFFGEKDDHEIR